jgi:hypothetical protein
MNTHELQAAVVASDSRVIDAIPLSLRKIGITTTVYRDTQSAIRAIGARKLDAFFVDRELDPELSVLQKMRAARGNRKALAFAIIPRNQTPGGAFRVADFLMDKPLTAVRVDQALRAAHGFMLKERMSYFRKAVHTTATLVDSTGQTLSAVIINISQGGVAVESTPILNPGQLHQLSFHLPEQENTLTCLARVVWSDQRRRAGLCFTDMSASERGKLMPWIAREFNKAFAA